jgi:5-methylcytosine-specific restriction endonuclease McrA
VGLEALGMSPEAAALQLRKWTPEEKQSVIDLREQGRGPLAIAKTTGIPLAQVKFWVYGPRMKATKKRTQSANSAENSKRGYYRTKYNDWYSWKASTLRSGFLSRLRKLERATNEVPATSEIKAWLVEQPMACVYCGKEVTEATAGVDHAMPLSRDGHPGLVNLRLCCRGCNMVKGALDEAEYRALLGLIAGWNDGGKSLQARLKRGFIGRASG